MFAFNGGSKSTTVINAANGKVVGTIELGGKPESGVADGAGHVFVNCEDTAEVLKLDAREMKVLDRWSVAPADCRLAWRSIPMPVGSLLVAEASRLWCSTPRVERRWPHCPLANASTRERSTQKRS